MRDEGAILCTFPRETTNDYPNRRNKRRRSLSTQPWPRVSQTMKKHSENQDASVLIQDTRRKQMSVGEANPSASSGQTTVNAAHKRAGTSSPSTRCARGSQVAHLFPSATRCSRSAATICQQLIHRSISYHQIPTCHQPTFVSSSQPAGRTAVQVYHQSLLPSPTPDSPCVHSSSATQRNPTRFSRK